MTRYPPGAALVMVADFFADNVLSEVVGTPLYDDGIIKCVRVEVRSVLDGETWSPPEFLCTPLTRLAKELLRCR